MQHTIFPLPCADHPESENTKKCIYFRFISLSFLLAFAIPRFLSFPMNTIYVIRIFVQLRSSIWNGDQNKRNNTHTHTQIMTMAMTTDDPNISSALFVYSYKIFCNKWHVLFSCPGALSLHFTLSIDRNHTLSIYSVRKCIYALLLMLFGWIFPFKLILRWYKCGDLNTHNSETKLIWQLLRRFGH